LVDKSDKFIRSMEMKAIQMIAAMLLIVVASVVTAHALTNGSAPDDDDEFEFKGVVQSLPNTPGRIGDWTNCARKFFNAHQPGRKTNSGRSAGGGRRLVAS
jgi:hypothetical protein